MAEQRVIIVGGGVVGAACAYYLAKAGAPTMLLDKGAIASGASFGNAGLISPGHPPIPRPGVIRQGLRMMFSRQSPLYIKPTLRPSFLAWMWRFRRACGHTAFIEAMKATASLSWETIKLFDELMTAESLRCDYRRGGFIEVCTSEKGLDDAREEGELLKRFGFDPRPMGESELLQREPALREEVVGGVWHPQGRSCDPLAFTAQLAKHAGRRGCVIREQVAVAEIAVERGRVAGVVTETGERIPASRVVLAAGVWSGPLARCIGLKAPIEPARGYHVDVEDETTPLPKRALLLFEAKIAATPMNSRLRLAGTLEFSGMNSKEQRVRQDILPARALEYLRDIPAREASRWSGLRPCPPDGLPLIGPAPRARGAFIAAGHAMLGLTFAPITGKMIAQMIAGQTPSVDPTPFRPDRF